MSPLQAAAHAAIRSAAEAHEVLSVQFERQLRFDADDAVFVLAAAVLPALAGPSIRGSRSSITGGF